jgi:alpha-amylase
MRRDGVPTIFWKDYYVHGLKEEIDRLIQARKKYAYGDAFESEENDELTYSYIRSGDKEHPKSGLVMMITQAESGDVIEKNINTGKAKTSYYDYTGNIEDIVETDKNGNGLFKVKGTAEEGYSVWVQADN